MKKKIIRFLPYVLVGLFATNLAEGWRLLEQTDFWQKVSALPNGIGVALQNPLPSLHPVDLTFGALVGIILFAIVYFKGKNAKKYRHGIEHGSARWGNHEDIAPYMDPKPENNVILTNTEGLMMSNRPKMAKYARNKNVLVIGGSGSGKTRFFLKPNLLQMHSSYVVTDPKGSVLTECGNALAKNGYRMANFETFTLFKWVMKTFFAVTLITNTFDIVMAVFDVAQNVIASSSGVIVGSTAITELDMEAMQATLEAMEVGPLLGLYLQSAVIGLTMQVLSIAIFIIVYGRMIEIYLMTSLAPIPMATFGNREQSMMGQNYLRSLFALGFQGFLILICVGIYAVLVQGIAVSENMIASIWGIVGYTVLLAFTLFKTGSLSKAILGAH